MADLFGNKQQMTPWGVTPMASPYGVDPEEEKKRQIARGSLEGAPTRTETPGSPFRSETGGPYRGGTPAPGTNTGLPTYGGYDNKFMGGRDDAGVGLPKPGQPIQLNFSDEKALDEFARSRVAGTPGNTGSPFRTEESVYRGGTPGAQPATNPTGRLMTDPQGNTEVYPGQHSDQVIANMAKDLYSRAMGARPTVSLNTSETVTTNPGGPLIPTFGHEKKYAAVHGTSFNPSTVKTERTQDALNPLQGQLFGAAANLAPHGNEMQKQEAVNQGGIARENVSNQGAYARQQLANKGHVDATTVAGKYSVEAAKRRGMYGEDETPPGMSKMDHDINKLELSKLLEAKTNVMNSDPARQKDIDAQINTIKSKYAKGAQAQAAAPVTWDKFLNTARQQGSKKSDTELRAYWEKNYGR